MSGDLLYNVFGLNAVAARQTKHPGTYLLHETIYTVAAVIDQEGNLVAFTSQQPSGVAQILVDRYARLQGMADPEINYVFGIPNSDVVWDLYSGVWATRGQPRWDLIFGSQNHTLELVEGSLTV